MRVNELAKKLAVTADTVRYYTRIGILEPAKSTENGYKHYSKDDESRLRFVLKANMTKAVGAWEAIEDKEPNEQNICELIEMWDEIELLQGSD